MGRRAEPSGVTLDSIDAAVIKGMLARGDRQHDIAAWFGVNAGRVAEIASGVKFATVSAAPQTMLPPAGPYLSGRQLQDVLSRLSTATAQSSS